METTLAQTMETTAAVSPRILVIDDERPIRDMYRDFLRMLGYRSDCVGNGAEALAQFEPGRYDLIVTDLVMPGLSGLEVAAAIRGRDRAVPIVMITGSDLDSGNGIEALGLMLLRKPIGFDAFKETIRGLLDVAAGQPGAAAF
jgi:DNA-binding response OmpR family regulator